jgi:chemotaxis protein MotB
MRTLKLSAILFAFIGLLMITGCGNELQDCRIANDRQREHIAELRAEIDAKALQLDELKRQLATAQQTGGIEMGALQQQIAALEEDLAKKKQLIASMQQKLLYGGAVLPAELNTLLEDFAKTNSEMVTFDSNLGVLKFKSDLLFEKGSDTVASTAVEAIKSLCAVMNSEEGKKFDVIIAGHTDDIPIRKPDTAAKHPTNWHLSAHRAISVLNVMTGNQVESKRLSVRGFGEYRPVADNLPGNKGNPQNRRVEIFIVAAGA